MKHSWHNLKLETYPEIRSTKQVIDALQNGNIPFRIISPLGTYYIDPKGKYKPAWGIHTGVKIVDRKIISADTGEILAMRNHKLRILAYKNTQTFTTTWRKLL